MLKAYNEFESRVEHLKHRSLSKPDRIKAVIDSKVGKITKKEINHIKSAELAENAKSILAPGEDYVNFRKDHDRIGIFVDDEVWKTILAL